MWPRHRDQSGDGAVSQMLVSRPELIFPTKTNRRAPGASPRDAGGFRRSGSRIARMRVALVAQLVQPDDFSFDIALRLGGSARNRGVEQRAENSCRGQE